MTTDRAVIEVRNLHKWYATGFWRRKVCVLNDVSFSVRQNEVVGFLGANGAGKTTTIKIVNCLAFPDSGGVRIFGESGRVRAVSRRRIGFMPEQPYFYEYLTGAEFLGLCGRLNGMGGRETRERAVGMLARVGLDGAGDTAIRKYSKGMMQRLGLAQALLHDPELVILDEPMSGLDPMGRMDVRSIIAELKAAGKTVFFSTHIISDVEALCDRVVLLDRGRKLAEGTVADLVGAEVHYIELVFSPVLPGYRPDDEEVPFVGAARAGDSLVLRVGAVDDADRWIVLMRGHGARLRSMVQMKRRLEEIYVERLSGIGGRSTPA
jgi:ABC-2 type transport system ATP-binding protein